MHNVVEADTRHIYLTSAGNFTFTGTDEFAHHTGFTRQKTLLPLTVGDSAGNYLHAALQIVAHDYGIPGE